MNPLRRIAIKTYMCATAPVRWVWSSALSRSNRYPIGVLFYHRVSDVDPNPWTISTESFERQIQWLQEKFDIISLEEVQRRMVDGNDRPAVAITFDDGYADNCLTAMPYLINNQIPATYFVSNEFVTSGKSFPHDAQLGKHLAPNGIESLKLMSRAGIEIGAHSRTHCDLGQVTDPEVLFDELVVSRDQLEDIIECKIRYFAFPYGQFENLNDDVFQLARLYGFQGVCSAYGGMNSPGNDSFHLQRIHGDAELARVKNWLQLDPRTVLRSSYPVPEWNGPIGARPDERQEEHKQSDSAVTNGESSLSKVSG